MGVSSARNVGLNIAKGKYVLFADPDDYLSHDYVQKILSVINLYSDVDMIIFDYYEETANYKFFLHTIPHFREGFIKNRDLLEEFMLDHYLLSHLHNKVLRKTLFDKFRFDETISYMEDYKLLTDVSLNVEKTYYEPYPIYYYCYNDSGLSKVLSIEKQIRSFYIIKDRYEKYNKVLHKKIFHAPAVAAMGLISLKYEHDLNFNVDIFTKYINSNIINILMDNRIKIQVKKRCVFVYVGVAKYYYFFKKEIKKFLSEK